MSKYYRFIGISNGCLDATRMFTKASWNSFQCLKQEDQISVIFAGDSHLPTDSRLECHKMLILLWVCFVTWIL